MIGSAQCKSSLILLRFLTTQKAENFKGKSTTSGNAVYELARENASLFSSHPG